ncbi:acylphosphatase [Magnetospira thiophila]
MIEQKSVLVRIEGRVQGVWFRGWTTAEAQRRGLNGWVRNRRDGSVEALFSGPVDRVNDMLAACATGPTAARVSGVYPKPADPPQHPGFVGLPTL